MVRDTLDLRHGGTVSGFHRAIRTFLSFLAGFVQADDHERVEAANLSPLDAFCLIQDVTGQWAGPLP